MLVWLLVLRCTTGVNSMRNSRFVRCLWTTTHGSVVGALSSPFCHGRRQRLGSFEEGSVPGTKANSDSNDNMSGTFTPGALVPS